MKELERLASFCSCTQLNGSNLRPQNLSRMGFKYNSRTALIQCHCCSFTLKDFKLNSNDISSKHEKWAPSCPVLLGNNSSGFEADIGEQLGSMGQSGWQNLSSAVGISEVLLNDRFQSVTQEMLQLKTRIVLLRIELVLLNARFPQSINDGNREAAANNEVIEKDKEKDCVPHFTSRIQAAPNVEAVLNLEEDMVDSAGMTNPVQVSHEAPQQYYTEPCVDLSGLESPRKFPTVVVAARELQSRQAVP